VRPSSSSKSASGVKTPTQQFSNQRGTRLIPIALERKGQPGETYYVPECAACGRPILNFREANISTLGETEDELIPIGKLGDADAFVIPSAGAFAFCKTCDDTSHSPWVGAHCVFKNDQRYSFEKRGGAA
jgi:hypothetical protein